MFACIKRRQIIAANEKLSFQPLLERVLVLMIFRKINAKNMP